MQTLNQLLQAAEVLNDLTRQKHTHTLPALADDLTVYIHADDAAVRIVRWSRRTVEATIETRPPIGWRMATEYDENGVYIVAMKRGALGRLSKAALNVFVPQAAHLVLRLQGGLVTLDHVHGTLHIPPAEAIDLPELLTSGETKTG